MDKVGIVARLRDRLKGYKPLAHKVSLKDTRNLVCMIGEEIIHRAMFLTSHAREHYAEGFCTAMSLNNKQCEVFFLPEDVIYYEFTKKYNPKITPEILEILKKEFGR